MAVAGDAGLPFPGQDPLLRLLDPDPSAASEKLRRLRARLVRYFEWNQCSSPEDLAQESLMRCIRRLSEGQQVYAADPVSYIFGFAKTVLMERRGKLQERQLDEGFDNRN